MPERRRLDTRLVRRDDETQCSSTVFGSDAQPSNAGRIADMVKREVEKWHNYMLARSDMQMLSNPFVDDIMRIEYPTDLRLPNIKTYLRRSDPKSHINAYYGSMMMM